MYGLIVIEENEKRFITNMDVHILNWIHFGYITAGKLKITATTHLAHTASIKNGGEIMSTIVVYKSRYGATKTYAQHIAKELNCDIFDIKRIKINDLLSYDTIILGGGLYAEIIAGASLITKNYEKLKDKKLIIFTTGLTPLDCREYYDKMVIEKNFKPHIAEKIKIFNFMGKMIIEELSLPHKTAIKALKKLMSGKENPTEMEKLLIDLCDNSGDFTNLEDSTDLIFYAKEKQALH